MEFTVAIDGPAAAGKGTLAKRIARHFGFKHLDTGTLYRAVGLKALEQGRGIITAKAAAHLAERLAAHDMTRHDLRGPMASRAASKVAAMPEVREALMSFQRSFARQEGGAVLDGRDIGTVICPEAEVKLFVTASDAVRAKRRHTELAKSDTKMTLSEVKRDLASRDARDSGRMSAPLAMASDAVLLDTTDLSIEAAVAEAIALTEERLESVRS
ncbi:MAG: (d)CMP kinase [Pseudomonadota bacterium]